MTKKTLGCGIQTIEYQYQMRGWLTQLNDPTNLNKGFALADKQRATPRFFGMKLAYDGVGNITTWDYRNAQTSYGPPYDLAQKPAYQYGFSYDNLNRLKTGNLTQSGNAVFGMDNLNYDDNGNITTLNRTMGAATDRLSYAYKANSNQLASVSDGGAADFAQSSGYEYDGNGNLVKDSGKGITTPIRYNHLNLPGTVVHSGGTVTYTYSASGQKLKADFGGGKAYDYIGGLVYDQSGLEFIPTAEGRVLPPGRASTTVTTGSSTSVIASNRFYRYEYHLKDHLGNLRVACRCGERQNETSPGESYEPLVVQEQHYDPFGLDLTGLNSQMGVTASRFKYNSKEEQPGLGWIDYGARMYDPAVGRWLSIDPHAEKYESISPYSYGFDNPIRFVDLQGKDPGDVVVLFAGANIIPFSGMGPFDYLQTARTIQDQIRNRYANVQGGSVRAFESKYLVQSPYGEGELTTDPNQSILEAYEYIKENYKEGGRIILYGYSWGGVLVQELNKRLQKEKMNVRLEILIDAAQGGNSANVDRTIRDNVQEAYAYYQTDPSLGIKSRGYPSKVQNQEKTKGTNTKVSYVRDKSGKFVNATHSNIDDAQLQNVVDKILNVLNQPKVNK